MEVGWPELVGASSEILLDSSRVDAPEEKVRK